MNAIAFLGGGRIAGALCAGLRLGGYDASLIVYDRNKQKMRALRRESQVEVAPDLKCAVDAASILVMAVRPASIAELLAEVRGCGRPVGLCISLAAGIPLPTLRAGLPGAHWVRAMPSPVCRVGHGLTGLCFDRGVTKRERVRVRALFQRMGQVVEVPENQFDVFTAAYSSSHGYHALSALSAAAGREGLDAKTSLVAAAHALADGILYWRESGLSLDELLHEAATPGGIASATMDAMDRAGYRRTVAKGLAAGIARARQNAG
ncbi:MAG TPA: pyrroline-5-carboxylate reductase dimerization domain-containing protein [Candidatus Sulfotelmatobacter sp.]|nr:pyrroline-5-carboxylate reductase dimerization domain-containing protein [Candidatus Sulfotelmatobacter sp.]